jgi:hypothetical protein
MFGIHCCLLALYAQSFRKSDERSSETTLERAVEIKRGMFMVKLLSFALTSTVYGLMSFIC